MYSIISVCRLDVILHSVYLGGQVLARRCITSNDSRCIGSILGRYGEREKSDRIRVPW